MRCSTLCCVLALALPVVPAAAQAPAETPYSRALPAPAIDENAGPTAYLNEARGAIAAGRTGEAMEALERAESRALGRSVRPSLVHRPSQQPLVEVISNARAALANGDRMQALELIGRALNAEASEPQ